MLFSDDIFSNATPCYSAVTESLAENIRDVLRAYYFDRQAVIDSIQKVGALEINSHNFRATIDGTTYHLKCLSPQASIPAVTSQFALAEKLREAGQPFPAVLKAKNHQLLVTDDRQQGWIVTSYIEGHYFAGHEEEVYAVGARIGGLYATLANKECLGPAGNDVLARMDSLSMSGVATLIQSATQWEACLPAKDYALLSRHMHHMEDAVRAAKRHADAIMDGSPEISHIDLHPHNILINGDGLPVFLDVESLRPHPRLVSIGFAIYKLMRQYAARHALREHNHEQIGKVALGMCHRIIEEGGLSSNEMNLLSSAATLELCRRLSLIIELNINNRNTAWNKVLPMHIAGLQEIPLIFSRFSS